MRCRFPGAGAGSNQIISRQYLHIKNKVMNLTYSGNTKSLYWQGSPRAISFDEAGISKKLEDISQSCYVLRDFRGRIGLAQEGTISSNAPGLEVLAVAPPVAPSQLGDP